MQSDSLITKTLAVDQPAAAIYLRDVQYRRSPADALVINIAQWSVVPNSRTLLYGESGVGKSTLLHLLAGILQPTSGEIVVDGAVITQMNTRQRDLFRAHRIGVVFQSLNLIPYLTVLENVLLAAGFAGHFESAAEERARSMLSDVNLDRKLFSRQAQQLSLGQQQRVAIVRCMINEPKILLMDEPTSALDAANRDAFMSMLLKLLEQYPSTLVCVSHDQSLASYFDSTASLGDLNRPELG